jgi:hypothetical protein
MFYFDFVIAVTLTVLCAVGLAREIYVNWADGGYINMLIEQWKAIRTYPMDIQVYVFSGIVSWTLVLAVLPWFIAMPITGWCMVVANVVYFAFVALAFRRHRQVANVTAY